MVKHWPILSNFFVTPWFLFFSIALTVRHTFWPYVFDFWVGQIEPRTVDASLTSHCSGDSGSSMLLSCSRSDSTSATQSSSLSSGLSKSRFQLSQSSVSEMWSGAVSLAGLTELRLKASDSMDFYDLSSFSWEVLWRPRWWQRRSFWQFELSSTIMLREWPGCFDDHLGVRHLSH